MVFEREAYFKIAGVLVARLRSFLIAPTMSGYYQAGAAPCTNLGADAFLLVRKKTVCAEM